MEPVAAERKTGFAIDLSEMISGVSKTSAYICVAIRIGSRTIHFQSGSKTTKALNN